MTANDKYSIRSNNIFVEYPNSQVLSLSNLSFKIKKGEKVMIELLLETIHQIIIGRVNGNQWWW